MTRLTILPLALGLALTTSATAQPGYQWNVFTSFEAADGGPFVAAAFGVPETDDTAIHLFCDVEGAQPVVQALFSTPTGAYEPNEIHQFQWRTELGSVTQSATITLAEEFGGVALTFPLDAILMQQLASASQITYGLTEVTDFPEVVLTLGPNQTAAQTFVEDCHTLAAQTLGAGGAAPVLTPDFGPNLTGHVWQRFTEVSDDIFETVLRFGYAVPETDDILVSAQCVIGAQGPLVALQVAADIDGMPENGPAVLRVVADDGRQVDIDGTVVGTQAEYGISGVEMVLGVSDPAWLVIAAGETVSFERLGARGGFTLTGNGPSTIGPFLADCDQIDLLTPESGERPAAPINAQEGYLSCDSFGRVASTDTGQPTQLTFRNETSLYRVLSWIDPTGTFVDQGAMNPGEELTFTTDPGHIWMASDGPGNCRELIQPVAGQSYYALRVE